MILLENIDCYIILLYDQTVCRTSVAAAGSVAVPGTRLPPPQPLPLRLRKEDYRYTSTGYPCFDIFSSKLCFYYWRNFSVANHNWLLLRFCHVLVVSCSCSDVQRRTSYTQSSTRLPLIRFSYVARVIFEVYPIRRYIRCMGTCLVWLRYFEKFNHNLVYLSENEPYNSFPLATTPVA